MRYMICVLFLLLPAVAAAEIVHVGATDPATEGWYVWSGTSGYAGDDCWITDTWGHSQWRPVIAPSAADFAGDWFLIVDCRWVAGPKAESRATIFDGFRSKSVAFTWDATAAYYYQAGAGDTVLPGVDPTIRHEYRLDYTDADATMAISVDGVPLVQMESYQQNDTAGQYMLYFGDNNSAAVRSTMEWYGVGFNAVPSAIPEPAALVLLVIAVAGIVVYAWRRSR